VRLLIAALLVISACAPVAQPPPSSEPTMVASTPTSPRDQAAPTPTAEPTPATGPQLDAPVVTLSSTPFPIEPTLALTRSAVAPGVEDAARWGIERYLEGLDRYRDHGDFLPVSGAFGKAVAAALDESRTPGVRRTFVLESLRIESLYRKPWGTQALADVRVTIVDRAVDRAAADQREVGLLRLSGDRRLRVIDGWNEAIGRWFNESVPNNEAGLAGSVAQAVGWHLRAESWVIGLPAESYFGAGGPTPFHTARAAHLATFDRATTPSRTFESVTGAVERFDTFGPVGLGGIATVRIAATVATTDAAGQIRRLSVERRVKVFFGNWTPVVVDEEVTPGVWRSGGDRDRRQCGLMSPPPAVAGLNANPHITWRRDVSDIDDLRRLVQRTFEFQRSSVLERRVPERFVDLIPVPPSATLLGSVVRGDDTEPDQVTAYLDVPGSVDAVKSWYDTRLASLGYRPHVPQQPGDSPGGGFRHTMRPFGAGAMYCKGPDSPYYSLGLRGGKDVQDAVLSWHGGDTGWNPCAPQPHHGPPMSDAMRSLPALDAPNGVMMQGGGGGGGGGMWTSYGQAFTEMPASDLRDHFAAQLAAAGCTELDRGGDATAAWGRWKLPQDDHETIVAVVAAMPKVRHLQQHTFSPSKQERQIRQMRQYGGGIGWSTHFG